MASALKFHSHFYEKITLSGLCSVPSRMIHSIFFSFGPDRSSCSEVLCKIGVLRNVAKFTGKHLCQSLFFNKVAGLRSAALFKKRLWHRCFPVNFAIFLRTPFFTEHLRWLLLDQILHKCKIASLDEGKIRLTFLFDFQWSFSRELLIFFNNYTAFCWKHKLVYVKICLFRQESIQKNFQKSAN